MTDHDDGVVPLGRRLDALARARMAALVPRPHWAPPLELAMRHIEQVADVLGQRFERTELRPPTEQPFDADLLAAPRAAAVAVGRVRHGAGHQPASSDPSRRAGHGGPALPGDGEGAEASGDDRREVPAPVRSRLRREVGPAADLMRVHEGARADAYARAADADAVTVGADVFLRQGRWAPHREEGVALLAHEATHVAGLVDPGEAWRRAVGGAAEEALARARERSFRAAAAAPSPAAAGGGTAWPAGPERFSPSFGRARANHEPGPAATASTGVAARPAAAPAAPAGLPVVAVQGPGLRAGVERDLSAAVAAPDLEALRRGVIAEVMQRLRSEIERGA